MYCTILYGEPPPEAIHSASSAMNPQLKQDKKDSILYINPDCALQILLDYIRESLNIEQYQEFDLCDFNGELKNVNDHEPSCNATTVLEPLGHYVCVLKFRNADGVIGKMIPLVSSVYGEISLKLRKHVRVSKRFSFEMLQKRIREASVESTSLRRSINRSSMVRKKSSYKY